MANFSNNVMTDVGRVMFGDVQMGATLIPTKIVIGSGRIPSGKTARTMTDVVTPVVDLTITKKQKSNDGTAIFGGVYSNENVSTDFYFRELALYAKAGEDGDEVLFSYGNAGEAADYMPAYSSGTPVQRQIDLAFYVGNDAQVDLTIADGVYVTMDQLETELDEALTSKIGQPNGIASLDSTGKVPSDQLPDIDCGIWDESPVDIEVQEHNVTPETHESMIVDGNNLEVMDDSTTLKEHIVSPYAHQNLILDGNEN